MLNAIVGESILICGESERVRAVEKMLKPLLTFDNPDYEKKVRMGKWTGNTPRQLSLIRHDGHNLSIPFGMLPWVFKHKKLFDNILSTFKPLVSVDYQSGINLYGYQENAVEAALKARQGVIVAPCGSGKTQIGLELVARIGGRALWVTHTHDLLSQSMDRAKGVFGIDPITFGTITAGKMNVGPSITFSTVQTLFRADLSCIKDYFDVVIVDECHHCVGTPTQVTMFSKVLSSIRARYKFGLTATPKRADGLTPCMYALIGDKVCEISREEVEDTTCPVSVEFVETEYSPEYLKILMPDGTISYPKLISDITIDRQRNEAILEVLKNCEYPCLVLTDRVQHCSVLQAMADRAGINCGEIYGFMDKQGRKRQLERLSCGNMSVLFGTFALAKEGLDIPELRTLVMATPQKNDSLVTQAAGRVARKCEGKSCGKIVDFVDIKFGMLAGWKKKRATIYRKLGFNILENAQISF